MIERCILAIRFTPAGAAGEVRRAVGGFLRYVQHRDLHPTENRNSQQVAGMLKYVAYRDQASARAELFGPAGSVGSRERKELAAFVSRSLEASPAQSFRSRTGELLDRRRAVYRMVISPERAQGLDLRLLTTAAIASLERDLGVTDLRWMAAIHRNTAHPHVHMVLAGMRQDGAAFVRVDITKVRLAAMKGALVNEIERQRAIRPRSNAVRGRAVEEPSRMRVPRIAVTAMARPALEVVGLAARRRTDVRPPTGAGNLLRLAALAHRYRRQMERAADEEARRLGWERVA